VDLAVSGLPVDRAVEALARASLAPSVSFERVRFGGNIVSRIALLGSGTTSGLNVADLVEPRPAAFAARVVARALAGRLRDQPVAIVTPEHFVLLKVLSTRDRDVEDAASVVRTLGPRLDLAEVEREAVALAAEIPDHDVAGRLDRAIRGAQAP